MVMKWIDPSIEVAGVSLGAIVDDRTPCRSRGGPSCTYVISW